jgi:signal transduction histidine kinase
MMRRWLRALLLWAGLLPAVQASVMALDTAQVRTTVEGVTEAAQVTLPYHWDRMHSDRSGEAVFELPFALQAEPAEPYAVLLMQVGNTAEIWLNGILLSRNGDLGTPRRDDYAKAPRYVLIPAQLLRRDNLFRILIHADGGRRAGLSLVQIGPESEVRDRFNYHYRWRVAGPVVVAVFSLIVGVIALLLWLTQVDPTEEGVIRRAGFYLSAGLAELCWMLRLIDPAITHPPLFWPWWGVLQTVAYAGWICCAALFCHQVAGWHRHASMRWVRRLLWVLFLTAGPAAWMTLTFHRDYFLTGWYGFASFLFIGYGVFYFWSAVRRPSTERMLVATAGMFNVLVGFRDWLVIRAHGDFSEIAWMRYSSVLFGLALGYIVITRFRQASAQARDLMDNMAAKVQEKEVALAQSYAQFEQLAREQERAAERTRILRDMHDGVGSHISAAIRQLQSGRASNEELLQTLRDSLDQLKLSIDAMNLPPGDITTLLANLRYRLEPRFKASDIALTWEVDLLPPVSRLDAKAMRQLQFMVYEALSNVLQHAQASELRIELRGLEGGGARLRVIDNGRGFDPGRVTQKGLNSLRERAAAVGARLGVCSAPGSTVIEITLD